MVLIHHQSWHCGNGQCVYLMNVHVLGHPASMQCTSHFPTASTPPVMTLSNWPVCPSNECTWSPSLHAVHLPLHSHIHFTCNGVCITRPARMEAMNTINYSLEGCIFHTWSVHMYMSQFTTTHYCTWLHQVCEQCECHSHWHGPVHGDDCHAQSGVTVKSMPLQVHCDTQLLWDCSS